MSNKNKIAIFFEALGIDKVVGSLKNLTSNFSKTNKDIDSTTKSTKTFNDNISKLAQSLREADASSKKTGTSFKNIQKDVSGYNKASEDSIINIKQQEASYNDLKKVLEEQKEAYNSLIKEALNQTEVKINDISTANMRYIETLEDLKNKYGTIATTSKSFNDIQKEIADSIKITKDANKDLKVAVESGNTSFKNIESVVKKTTKALEEQNTTIGKLKQGFSSFATSGGNLLDSIGKLVPGIAGVKMGYEALSKVVGSTMKMAFDNSEKMRTSISNMKEYSTTVLKPLNDGFKLLGDTISNYVLKPLERDFQVAFVNSGDAAKKVSKVIETTEKEKTELLEGYEAERNRVERVFGDDKKRLRQELENVDKSYYRSLEQLSKNSTKTLDEEYKDEVKALEKIKETRDKYQKDLQKNYNGNASASPAASGLAKKIEDSSKGAIEQQRIVDELQKKIQQNTQTGDEAFEKSIDLEKKAFSASLKVSQAKEKTLAEQVKYLYEFKDIQVRIIQETVDSETERAKKIKELDKDVLTQKTSLYETSYKKIIENNGKITDSSISSMSFLEKEIITAQNGLNELSKLAFADTLKEMEAYQTAEVSMLNENKAFTSQVLAEEKQLTKSQRDELKKT